MEINNGWDSQLENMPVNGIMETGYFYYAKN